MKKYLIYIFSFIALVLIVGNGLVFFLNHQLKKSDFYKTTYVAHPPSKTYDFILAGSSRGLTTLDTRMLDSAFQVKGFNISMDDTGLPSHFLMIKHFFESGNSATTCVLVLDWGQMESSESELSSNDYRFAPFSDRPYVREYFKSRETGIVKPLSLSAYLPLLGYSYYNMELFYPAILSMAKPRFRNRFDENGDYSYPEVSGFNSPSEEKIFSPTLSNPLLQEIKEYLSTKNCQLLIYVAPYYGMKLLPSNPNGYALINHSNLLSDPKYFFDKDHITPLGKKQATLEFIPEFQKVISGLK